MARIGWFDAHSRRRLNQQEMFHCTLLNPIRDDLLEFLWLNERYNCQGQRSRGYGFMFYPAMVAMMSREVWGRKRDDVIHAWPYWLVLCLARPCLTRRFGDPGLYILRHVVHQ
jgi:hypothetical protein